MKNLISWFEIPVSDIARAIKFYEEIFGLQTMHELNFQDFKMAMFPSEQGGVNEALCQGEWYKPSKEGVLIYFSFEDLSLPLSKIEAAGGKILMPRKQISEEYGFMAMFSDTEGNRIALHSQK